MEVCKSKPAPIDLTLCISNGARSPTSEITGDSFPPREEYGAKDGSSDTAEYAEKVEAMLSTAIMQQEDIWNLLMLSVSEGLAYHPDSDGMSTVAKISPEYFFTMKGKLENSINWCSLAQSRLKRIISPDPKRLTPSLQKYRPRIVDESELNC
ncbi:hypothetical protein M758_6G119800 [Ceratodon purpureus]|uniref:Uncharacterized protein n=1 Tax=Ceratodon purpureus TaxID=3225 RepID=A0A8T0HDR1_CERPU|nr:hypothetical protein KC19_6G124500 [Ceratodon purpureus]KAG0613658.1 hypothetical protein M758_6G119800 [Ceratodon purpureus]